MGGDLTSFPSLPRARVVFAIVRREYLVSRSYKLALVVGLLYGVLNLAVYFYISRTLDPGRSADLEGAPSYFAFAAVGVAIGLVFQTSAVSLAARIREEQLTGTLEALVAHPVSSAEIALGLIGLPYILAIARVGLYLLAATVLLGLELSDADWLGFAAVLAATGLALSGLGMALGAVVIVVKRAGGFIGFATFGTSFLSGAFFPVSELPSWLRPLADVLPLRYALDGLRAALLRGQDWGGDAVVLVLFGAAALPASLWLFGCALHFAKGWGSLSEY